MVLDDIHDKSRHGVESVIRVREREITRCDTFDVAVHTRFGTYPKEERRDVIHFEYALLRQLRDERDKGLLRRRGALKDAHPLLEPYKKFFSELSGVRLAIRLPQEMVTTRAASHTPKIIQ